MDAIKEKKNLILDLLKYLIITFNAKQKSLGDLNFFFQSKPKNTSTFSNFAKQTRSF
jgi:hypothetical protein